MSDWIDITKPLVSGMPVYSGHEQFQSEQLHTVAEHGHNLSKFSMGSHCGTHMDSPAHFVADGLTIEAAPLELLIGPARVVTVRPGEDFSAVPQGTTRLIMRAEFPGLTPEQAHTLFDKGVRLLGTTSMSIAPSDNEAQIHKIFLENGAWILENVTLDGVEDGEYELVCLPLKLQGLEGAPARALLRRV